MQHSSYSVTSLVERVDRGEIRLPEIQRGFVWKSPQVAKLLDSLYRQYPSGSLLLWSTDDEVAERAASIASATAPSGIRPLYLP